VVQPAGWQSEPFSLVFEGEQTAPIRGERLFVGLQQARLYKGDTPLRAVAFAQSA
jgi:sulfate transport system ATP-binding protein